MTAPTTSALSYALRRCKRGWRSGELLILALALVVAVASASAVGVFTERVRGAIAAQTGEALGADLMLQGRVEVPDDYVDAVHDAGARSARITNLPSVVFHGDDSTLAAIKAVTPGYPLRGALRVADEPYAPESAADGLPAPDEVWVDARLWAELRLAPGAPLQVGAATLRVTRVITYEPDRGGGFVDLAPRVLMQADALDATGLVQPGSRLQHALMIAGDGDAMARVRALDVPRGLRLLSPQDARPELRTAMDRAGRFLDLAVLAALLLAGAAVAICARSHGQRLRDEVALLKCLGAEQGFVAAALLAGLLMVGLVAGVVGLVIGLGAQAVLAALLAGLLQVSLPPPSAWPLLAALVMGLLMLLGFGAPPILEARRAPPVRVFQRDLKADRLSRAVPLAACAGIAALLWLQTGDLQLATHFVIGALGAVVALALLAWGLVLLLSPMRRAVGTAWRFGLGNISRRRGATVGQVVALGLALLALLLVSVSRQDLLDSWRDRLAPGTPNQFLVNVQPEQVQPLTEFFRRHGYDEPRFWPMARGRLVALNGAPVTADTFDDPETQRWINRDFNLSWTDTLGDDNRITAGRWWGEDGHGQPWLSADRYAVERLGLQLGDTLTLLIADRELTFTVTSFREVDWDSFRPNFFLLAAPGVIDDAHASWLTSFYLAPERRALMRELIREFPNVTALDLEAVMAQVRSIMDRINRAVEFIFLFTLAAGLTVLLAAIEGTREERVREVGLLRALGARRGTVTQGLLAEYALLGLIAGTVAAVAAQSLTWALAEFVFKIPYGPRPLLWITGAALGCALVTACGWIALRGTLNTPPHKVLRGG